MHLLPADSRTRGVQHVPRVSEWVSPFGVRSPFGAPHLAVPECRYHSMYRCESQLQPRGAHTLHRLLMAAHDAGFDPRTASPEALLLPMPPNAADRMGAKPQARTVVHQTIAVQPAHPVCPVLKR